MLLLSSVNQRGKQIRMVTWGPTSPSSNAPFMSADGPAHRFTRPAAEPLMIRPPADRKPDETVASRL